MLPYIEITVNPKFKLKFLIDTGSDSSYIDPKFIIPSKIKQIKSLFVKTLFKEHEINQQVIVPGFPEFKTKEPLPFYLFKFHQYFDGLIGLDLIKQLKIKLDFHKSVLETDKVTIPFIYRPNYTSPIHKIPPRNRMLIPIPIDTKEGELYIKPIEINSQTIIPEGIYKAKNYQMLVEVINFSNKEQTVIFEQPIKTEPISNYKLEINHCSVYNETFNNQDIRELIRTDHLNSEEKLLIEKLCQDFESIFQKENQSLTFTNAVKHSIDLKSEKPIFTKSYRYPYAHKEEVESQITKMLRDGIIRPSYSPWSSPIWIVPKKSDASGKVKWRLVVDYRKLNDQTIDDRYPLPNITEILDKLGRCNYFTTLDLASGFHQIEVNPTDIPKTAFTVDFGHYEYVRMPFGLKNAPSTFQRVMDNVLQGLQGKSCLCYMDDIVIFSSSLQEHISNLKQVFLRLKSANLKVQLDKSEFLHKELAFLGHIISEDGIKPNPEKIKSVKNFPLPKTEKQIKSFLGLLGYYRKFIRNFADITKPLTSCLRKDKNIVLDEEYISCFNRCKEMLCNNPILQYPDFTREFIVTTDASNFALGAVLSQGEIGRDLPICYASRTLNSSETNYSATEKELLAIVWAVKQFRPYLYGKRFKIVTDHKPLQWLMNLKEPNSKLVRWRLKLEEYDYEVIYKKGILNSNADALSRLEPEINVTTISSNQSEFLGFPDNLPDVDLTANTCNFQPESSTKVVLDDKQLGILIPNNPDVTILPTQTPLNEFKNQLYIKLGTTSNQYQERHQVFFKTKQRTTITISKNHKNMDQIIDHIIKAHTSSTGITAIACEDKFLAEIDRKLKMSPDTPTKCKILRSNVLLTDIEDPKEQQIQIDKVHLAGQHRGAEENYLQLRRTIYFPNMKTTIQQYVNKCHICLTSKYNRLNKETQLEITETATKPLDIIHMDTFSIEGRKFLTILDKFSKYGQAIPLIDGTSDSTLRELKIYISIHGIPRKIVTDNGSEFISCHFKTFCSNKNIELHFTTPGNSTGNSPVERFHSTLIEIYRITKINCTDLDMETDELMTDVIITYNNTIHSTTKMTPLELKNGHYTKLTIFPEANPNLTLDEHIQDHNNQYKNLCTEITKHAHDNKVKVIERLNKIRIPPKSIHTNDIVYEKLKHRNKHMPRFKRHVVKKNNKITITNDHNKRIHKNKIKRIISGPSQQPTAN